MMRRAFAVMFSLSLAGCPALLDDYTIVSGDGGASDAHVANDGALSEGQAPADADASTVDASIDGGGVESSVPDTRACNFQPFACNGGTANVTVTPPAKFCWHQTNNGANGDAPTPAACQTCGAYSCACVLAALPTFCNVKSCTDTSDEVIVMCQ